MATNGNMFVTNHLIDLAKTVRDNASLTAYPTRIVIRRQQNELLELFLINNASPDFARNCIFESLLISASKANNIGAQNLLIHYGADAKYPEKIKFALGAYKVALRVNHTIGINQLNIFFRLPESKITVPLDQEALDYDSALKIVTSKLTAYLESESSEISTGETGLLQQILNAYKLKEKYDETKHSPAQSYPELMLEQYLMKKPVIIQSGWPGHHVGVALFDDKLIVCNRGMHKDPNYNLLIYQITHPENITCKFMQWVRHNDSPSEFHETLRSVADLDHLLTGIKIPDQVGGVCVTANTRALVEALLVVMQPSTIKNPLSRAKIIYDNFINFSFLNEVKTLLDELKNLKTSEERDFYYLVFKELLIRLPESRETLTDQTGLIRFILTELPDYLTDKLYIEVPGLRKYIQEEVKLAPVLTITSPIDGMHSVSDSKSPVEKKDVINTNYTLRMIHQYITSHLNELKGVTVGFRLLNFSSNTKITIADKNYLVDDKTAEILRLIELGLKSSSEEQEGYLKEIKRIAAKMVGLADGLGGELSWYSSPSLTLFRHLASSQENFDNVFLLKETRSEQPVLTETKRASPS